MGCEYIYKDGDGKVSAIYQKALAKYGPEKAEEIYIRHMMANIDTRFSHSTTGKQIDERSNEVEAPEDSKVYIHNTTSKKLYRATEISSSITKAKATDAFEGLLKKEDPFEAAKRVLAEQQIFINFTDKQKADGLTVAKAIEADPTLLDRAKQDIQSMWNAQKQGGTDFHLAMSEIINQWNLAVEANDAAREKDPTVVAISIGNLGEVIRAAKDELKSRGEWFHEDTWIEKFDESSLRHAAEPFFKYVLEQEKTRGRLIIKSEVKVWTEKLKVPGLPFDGIAGTIDVLLATKDNTWNGTVDFKTKIVNKMPNFDVPTGRYMNFPFLMDDSPRNQSLAQQTLYAAILGTSDYNIPVSSAATFVIPLTFDRVSRDAKVGDNQYRASNIASVAERFDDTPADRMSTVLTYLKGEGGENIFEDAREKGIAGITQRWSGSNEDGVPNATWTKNWKKVAVEKAIRQKRKNKKGVDVVQLGLTEIEVQGKTDQQIRELLEVKYDESVKDRENIGRDIITVFNNPEAKVPKTLHNREAAVTALLRGINKTEYTLDLLQNRGKEFYGIGPDVLIATNKITGAITLLSAITTTNSKINFQGDGSGESKTSIFGNYQLDKDIESKSVSQELMTEARAHDFIALKLGLAALYIRKNQGKRLDIDQMRVVSMSTKESYDVTRTTFEEEVSKLRAFERYAGQDFPNEYRDLLKEIDNTDYVASTGQHLENLMRQIEENTDPFGLGYGMQQKKDLLNMYHRYERGELVGHELKKMLGNYVQAVATKIHHSVGDADLILRDKRFIVASKAFLEFMKFKTDLGKLAAERNSVAAINGAVSSGDPIQIRLHVMYNEASASIRSDMEGYFKDHKKVANALLKSHNSEWIGDTDKMFKSLYRISDDPEERMMLKDENDPTLTKEEKAYITFFNDSVIQGLVRTSPKHLHEGILNGTYWKRGTVPTVYSQPGLLEEVNFKDWKKLKGAVISVFKRNKKDTSSHTKNFLNFGFATQFDGQATDSSHGHSEVRRKMLGMLDLSAVKPMPDNIETNLALILNMLQLEAAEKTHYEVLIQSIVASHSMLASIGDRQRTGMSDTMINMWREMVIFNRYMDEDIAEYVDPINKFSSAMLFAYSLRQAMIEFSTGTLQTSSSLISNSVLNAFAEFSGKPENAGRYTMTDFAWGVQAWDAAFNLSGDGQRIRKMVWDAGMLAADANDLQSKEYEATTKWDVFKSEAGFYLNRLFFNSAITHTFLAQVKHLGITDAYVKKGDDWVYDETLDPRFFVYDPVTKIGEREPATDDEKRKHSVWLATRKVLDAEGQLNPETKRMKTPLTANERAEIKHYATRTYGSFNKDSVVHGEAWVLGRSMLRYKKWAMQKIANWNTKTVKDDMWGHWETIPDGKGGYTTQWVGDEFQGILQTIGFIFNEITSLRGKSALKNLNRYQRENLAKLFSDLVMMLIMLLLVLPLLSDTKPDPNAVDAVSGPDVPTLKTTKDSAKKAATNATSDLFFLTSLIGMGGGPGGSGILSSILPAVGTMSNTGYKAFNAIIESLRDEGVPAEKWGQVLRSSGVGRTGTMVYEWTQ